MSLIQFEVPNDILINLEESPETLSRELRVLAAVKLYELGRLSTGLAAELAGISRVEFLLALGKYQVEICPMTPEELAEDIRRSSISSHVEMTTRNSLMAHRFIAAYVKEGNGYVAHCLELGVVSQGDTLEEAQKNLKEAVTLYLDHYGVEDLPNGNGDVFISPLEVTTIA